MQPEEMLAPVQVGQNRDQTDRVRDQGRGRRSGDAKAWRRAKPEDEDRIQRDVESDRQQQKPERRLRITGAAQGHHHERIHVQRRHGEEDDAQVAGRERQRVERRAHPAQQHRRQQESGECDRCRDEREETGAGTDHALGLVEILGADALANQDRRCHADAEHRAEQEEQDHVRVRGRGQCRLAEEMPDPDRIDRPIQRLQHVAAEDRQREQQQGLADRAFGQHGGGALRSGHSRGVVRDARILHESRAERKADCGAGAHTAKSSGRQVECRHGQASIAMAANCSAPVTPVCREAKRRGYSEALRTPNRKS